MAKSGSRFLPPSGILDATLVDWGSGRTMHRVHDAAYAANLFNPSPTGNARFSPIRDEAGAVIPTLYAATTPRGALMETIFHDVPYTRPASSGCLPAGWPASSTRRSPSTWIFGWSI